MSYNLGNQEIKNETPPAGCTIEDNSSLTILARPKLSYAPPNLPHIWVKRTGWKFESITELRQTEEERQQALESQIILFLKTEVNAGHFHSKTSLISALIRLPNISREPARNTVDVLMVQRKIIEVELPSEKKVTRKKTYLAPAGFGGIQ